MIDPKLAGIVAAVSFLLSFLLGIINQTTFTWSLLRALIFAVAFFGIAAGVEYLYKKFLLPDENGGIGDIDGDGYGSNVDISIGDDASGLSGSSINDLFNSGENVNGSGDVEELEPVDDDAELETLDSAEASDVEELQPLDAADDGSLEELESEPLDQKAKYEYHNNGDIVSANNARDDFDIGAFVPGLAGLDEISKTSKQQPSSQSSGGGLTKTEYDMDSGTVEMTMEKRGGKELGFDVDGKKAAGAIQTLLSKDED
ncbi:MAG: hypothetical protein Ta2B_21180 [Termitinemataceae bacterium]|nr:MAG: hypothetical protein Ta2B_21180 [Termitinemataceae bacterium]